MLENAGQLMHDNRMNDPVTIYEMGMMPIDNAEVNDEDDEFNAHDEAGFEHGEVYLGSEELDEVASVRCKELASIPSVLPPSFHLLYRKSPDIHLISFSSTNLQHDVQQTHHKR